MGRARLESDLFTLNAGSGGDRIRLPHLIDVGGDDFLNWAVRPDAAFVQPDAAFA